MMKRILYIVCALAILTGCHRQDDSINGGGSNNSGVAIDLGVDAVGDVIVSSGVASKSGSIVDVVDFGTDTMAIYGLNYLNGTLHWEKEKRIVDTLGATVNGVGRVIFSKEHKYYPAFGMLNVYALYPSGDSCVMIHDNAAPDVNVAPSATVTLKKRASEQYDVMTGKGENFTVAQENRAKIKFVHALSMLRIKIYRDVDAVASNVSKIEVRGVNKAELPNIMEPTFVKSTNVADSTYFVAYDDAVGTQITDTTAASAVVVGSPLMVFPGKASVDKIILTIDGRPYTTIIPSTWELKQGYIATLTLNIRKFEVRFDGAWTISPWARGDTVNSGLENNGKMIRLSVPMVNAAGSAYSGAVAKAEVEINGKHTLKNIEVESTAGGVMTTKPFNSGILNNEPMYMTSIKFFHSNGSTLFEGKLYGGKLSTGQKVIIDTLNGGKLKIGDEDGDELKLNMAFGGFGNGTAAIPYEVATSLHLKNINNFKGSDGSRVYNGTSAGGAVFAQVEDIDLKSEFWTPIGRSSAPLYGRYNGKGYVIRNINVNSSTDAGLFGYIATPSGGAGFSEISNVTVVNGTVSGRGNLANVGGIAGYILGKVTNCYNGATISSSATSSAYTGGIVGSVGSTSSIVSGCVNTGAVSSTFSMGGIAGYNNQGRIEDSYNIGELKYMGTNVNNGVGGLVGTFLKMTGVINCSYNRGDVISNIAATTKATGGVLGIVGSGGTYNTDFRNNYYLEGVYSKGVGLNNNTMTGAVDPYAPKSEASLKAITPTLGANWQEDYTDEPINSGYPILKWQTKAWYSKIK